MPIYEYQCPACAHRFEKLQKISDPPATDCPACGGAEVRKLVSQSAFILKGAGWYKDHYGLKKGESKPASGESTPAAGDSKPAGGESKPAAAAAAPAATGASGGSSASSTSTGAA